MSLWTQEPTDVTEVTQPHCYRTNYWHLSQQHFLPGRKEEHFSTSFLIHIYYIWYFLPLGTIKKHVCWLMGGEYLWRVSSHTPNTSLTRSYKAGHSSWPFTRLQNSKQKPDSYSNTWLIHFPDGASPSRYINSTTLNHKLCAERNHRLEKQGLILIWRPGYSRKQGYII